jgi:glucose-6-phosphate dehydrogenase assembly protein OpcA
MSRGNSSPDGAPCKDVIMSDNIPRIDTEAILNELNRTYDDGVPDAAARTMTFIAYTGDPAIITWMRERMRTILEKRPSRLVLLDGTRDPRAHEVERIADAEWILLGTRGLEPEALRSIVHAFTITDVPVILLWGGERLIGDPYFLALNETVDSLVLDSSRITSTSVAHASTANASTTKLRELIAYFGQDRRYAVQDMAYLRLAPWQEMIANFFDDRELIDDLFALRNVDIVAGSQAEAYYFLGWLASRLEWSPCGPKEFCNRFGSSITCSVTLHGEPRRIYSITLHSGNATGTETIFCAELQEDGQTVSLTVAGGKTRPQRHEPLHDIDVVALLDRAILEPKTSDTYRATLEMAGEILDRQKTE